MAIIGTGIIDGMLVRELSRYELPVCLLEKELTRAAGIPMDLIANGAIVDETWHTYTRSG